MLNFDSIFFWVWPIYFNFTLMNTQRKLILNLWMLLNPDIEKQITSVWSTMIFIQLLLDSGTGSCLHCFHLIHLNNPLIFLLSVFYLIHTCGECLTSKQSPQRFTQQRVPTPLWGAHLQLMAWTDPRSVHNITLPLPPDLAPGDDGSERRTFKTTTQPCTTRPRWTKAQGLHTQWNPHKTSTILYERTSAKRSGIFFNT